MLRVYNKYHLEPLQQEELDFLSKKALKQDRVHDKILKLMLLGAFIFSFAGAWKNVQEEGNRFETTTVFSWENYFITLFILSALFYAAIRVSRSNELSRIKKDLKHKTKVIEQVLIRRKTFVPHNNTFHFYLNSKQKLSIEVAREDFEIFAVGDELSIEYSAYAGIYFGYF